MQPLQPQYSVSPPLRVHTGQGQYSVVYGPYYSMGEEHSLFPYSPDSGQTYHSQNYRFTLANGSHVINPFCSPRTSDNGASRADYFSILRDLKAPAASLCEKFMAMFSGRGLDGYADELYATLQGLLQANIVRLICHNGNAAVYHTVWKCSIKCIMQLKCIMHFKRLCAKHEQHCNAWAHQW